MCTNYTHWKANEPLSHASPNIHPIDGPELVRQTDPEVIVHDRLGMVSEGSGAVTVQTRPRLPVHSPPAVATV